MKQFNSINEFLDALGINSFTTFEGFYIFKIEDYFGKHAFQIGPYKHRFFEISFGYGHDVDVQLGSTTFNSLHHVLSFTTPFQTTSWKVNSFQDDSLGFMILFKPEILPYSISQFDLYKRYSFLNHYTSPVLFLKQKQTEVIVPLMKTMNAEFKQLSRKGKSIVLGAYLTILLEKIDEMFIGKTSLKVFSSRAEEITFLFEQLLRKEVNYKLKLADYADQLNISKSYLSEAIKKSTRKSAKVMVREFLMYNGKTLLLQSNDTIANIAFQLGFDDVSNFIKYFKSQSGLTPNQYRKQAR
ncbi:MAG: AraC family transcriptional regulator [Bacteroidota bacterium]